MVEYKLYEILIKDIKINKSSINWSKLGTMINNDFIYDLFKNFYSSKFCEEEINFVLICFKIWSNLMIILLLIIFHQYLQMYILSSPHKQR